MKPIRKILAALALAPFLATGAWAAYPDKPITLIVPFPAGGATDSVARIVAKGMEKQLGQPLVVENVGGAGSTIGAGRAATAKPDGYTVFLGSSSAMVISPHLYKELKYDSFKSFAPLGMVTINPFLFVTNTIQPHQTLKDMIAFGKANPGKLNLAIPGSGTTQHMALEMLMDAAQFKGTLVPFRGGAPAVAALLAGEVDVIVETPVAVVQMVKAGRMKPLAAATNERVADLSDAPTTAELGLASVEARSWHAMFTQSDVPADIVAKLRDALAKTLTDPETTGAMQKASVAVTPMSVDALVALMKKEFKSFGELIKSKNIRLQD